MTEDKSDPTPAPAARPEQDDIPPQYAATSTLGKIFAGHERPHDSLGWSERASDGILRDLVIEHVRGEEKWKQILDLESPEGRAAQERALQKLMDHIRREAQSPTALSRRRNAFRGTDNTRQNNASWTERKDAEQPADPKLNR